jgi:nicotinamide-nucleotide amidase
MLNMGNNKLLIMLPGPEEEIKYIMNAGLLDILTDKYGIRIKKSAIIHIVGLCEMEVADQLKEVLDIEKHLEEEEIEFYFKHNIGSVDLEVVCWGDNELLVEEMLHKLKSEIYAVLKNDIYGENNDTLESVLGKLLTRKRKTLTVAESCTGGMLTSKITDAPGSSIYFKQGVVTYSSNSKIKLLNVNSQTIKEHTAVSEEVAREMADNIKKISGANYAISVTGYAGPSASKDLLSKPGIGYIGLAIDEETYVKKVEFSGTRIKIKEKFTIAAMEMLWRQLKNSE